MRVSTHVSKNDKKSHTNPYKSNIFPNSCNGDAINHTLSHPNNYIKYYFNNELLQRRRQKPKNLNLAFDLKPKNLNLAFDLKPKNLNFYFHK